MEHRHIILSALALAIVTRSGAQIVINEVNVSNLSGLTDNFGQNEDWVELYNTTAGSIDISGWHLSDDPAAPLKWVVPPGTSMAANGHQIFWCSGRNTSGGGSYHTNFKLNQTAGDHIVLSDAGGVILDDYQCTARTKADNSRGRTTDGAATWSLFLTPTPNAANAGASAEYVSRPQLTPPAGFYAGAQNVSITGPAGATIRYTTDGTSPTATSTAYAGPINVAATTVIRAACFSSTPGVPPSFIETNSYFINDPHNIAVVSVAGDQLPTLFGGTQNNPIGSLEYFGEDGVLRDEATGNFNEHGNDSWAYPQRGVDYITRDQTGYNDGIHYPVFRTSPRSKYQRLILKAAANDNYPSSGGGAHIRDAYVHALAQTGGLKLDVRSYEPCVLYLNGQYWGVYELREKADDADYTKYYYDQDEFNVRYLKTWGGTWEEYGGPNALPEWNSLRTFIQSNDMGDATAFHHVDSLFNWKSLVDYFCLSSYTVCTDWLNWNTAWWRGLDPAGDHKKWGYALWDNDATFGHYVNYTGVPDQTPAADPCNAENLPDPGGQGHTVVLTKLIAENQQVHDYYVNRYIDLGNTVFNCNNMIPFLDSLIALIAPEMTRHCNKWGGTVSQWQGNVQLLRDFIDQRCVAIQTGLVDCYDLDGPYNVMFNVEPPGAGQIGINSITPPAYPFTGIYYGGITTTLEASGLNGYVFDHWETLHHTLLPSMQDSTATLQFTTTDTIIAHFRPPTQYEVLLLTDPLNTATITFNGQQYSSFPATASVGEDVPIDCSVEPNMFYDFLYWEIKQNLPNTNDSTKRDFRINFFGPDTIIAHLAPQEYGYWSPNAFTPNGDGYNDTWQPWGNVIDPENFELEIYDRWGRVMFATTDPTEGWDGTVGGGPVPLGVYAFRTHIIEGITRKKHDLMGHVTVVR